VTYERPDIGNHVAGNEYAREKKRIWNLKVSVYRKDMEPEKNTNMEGILGLQ
jgi:hypothetical protein